ncbi:S-adenosyl-L-methionine-dependent methyltransferase [Mytilinidion resinicola]|uniref:S-adenosyl-L-methionine-dependent methyltransferase n=1 Tax=Mytilinidion resinicola TaxID=574789 RepID=A0A6A6Z4Q6_9PEZI|nr:S-adenosyl-L-methionine-dependent methyltransferase [Mytilinidion resinicola]KAF2815274.1 S-adenosyl-L-methionine-dependent methyltransferase [Mytilinidion resinicola]
MFKAANGNKLILAPIDLTKPHLHILDIGTYDGTFLVDLSNNFIPSSARQTDSILGIDLFDAHFPAHPSEGMRFQIQNFLEPWPQELLGSFDLVHQRLMLAGAGRNTRANLTQTLRLVKPGGWIQLVEAEQAIGPNDGPAMQQFLLLMGELFGFIGVPMTYAHELAQWLEEEGFEEVETRVVPIPYGCRQPDAELREKGYSSMSVGLQGKLKHTKMIPGGLKSLDAAELEMLAPRLIKEMEERGAEYVMRYAWGRKPVA